jgi:L-alanine-DL-glutamate epimerase-like enolase superfamily enzyme
MFLFQLLEKLNQNEVTRTFKYKKRYWYFGRVRSCKSPIAGGEQEPSLVNFLWLIDNGALHIEQPDIFYFGGMTRSMRVARMAQIKKMECVPHISGSGLAHLFMAHFVSALPNAGPFHEYKGPQC